MTTVVQEHPKFGRLELVADADTLTQFQVERYLDEYRKLADAKYDANGKLVRAAVAASWIVSPVLTVAEVDGKPARWVTWAGKLIDTLYSEATQPDPKA